MGIHSGGVRTSYTVIQSELQRLWATQWLAQKFYTRKSVYQEGTQPRLCVVFSLSKEEFQINKCSYLDLQYNLLFSSKFRVKTPASPKSHYKVLPLETEVMARLLLKNLTPATECSPLVGLSLKPGRTETACEDPGESYYSSNEKGAW